MTQAPAPPTLTKLLPIGQGGYGVGIAFPDELTLDESKMSIVIPYASGVRRDGVGDLLEVEGIDFSRHRKNPVHLFDHGKSVTLPLGRVEDPETGLYTGTVDPIAKTASDLVFFYQGKGLTGTDRTIEKDHALFCEQVYDLLVKKFIRAGSIGYQVIESRPLPPDPNTGTPAGLHLLRVLKLESSTVVLPANQDTVRKLLALPSVCGKALSPWLVKSLQPYAPEPTVMVNGGIGGGEKALDSFRLFADSWDVMTIQERADLLRNAGESKTLAGKPFNQLPNLARAALLRGRKNQALNGSAPVPLANLPETQIPHSRWKPGAGAIKNIRRKYRKKAFFEKRDEADDKIYKLGIMPVRSSSAGLEFRNHDEAMRAYNVYVDFGIPVKTVNPTTLKVGGKGMGTKSADIHAVLDEFRRSSGADMPIDEFMRRTGLSIQQVADLSNSGQVRLGNWGSTLDRAVAKFGQNFIINRDGVNKPYDGKPLGRHDEPRGYVRKSMEKSIKSIRVKYRNRVVKGYANVELKFDTSKLTTDQLDAFAKDMAACGFGKPSGGRWSGGENAKLLSPMKKACFTADLEPGKAVHEALAKAHAVAAKHGAKWLGNAAESKAEPQPIQTKPMANGAKSMKVKTKTQPPADKKTAPKYRRKDAESAAVDAAEGAAAAEDVPVEPEADDGPVEKPGAEVLRKIHEHHLILMADYDEALQVMENEKVKAHLQAILEDIEAKLQETEDLFADEYPDAEPLENAGAGGNDDDADVADSGEEDVPPPEEVVEGMETADEKRLRGGRYKGTTRYQRKHFGKRGRKELCPACGAEGGMNTDNGYEPTPDGIPGPDQNAGSSGEKTFVKQLTQDDVGVIGGSSGFLKEASEYSGDWTDEMRTKAGGWHKQLDPLGLAEATQGETPVPADPESEAGPVDVEGTMEPAGGMETKTLKEVFTKQADDVKQLQAQVERLTKVLAGTGTNGTH